MKRKLTIHFHRAVTDPKAETLEVVVTPLASANHPENDKTILGLKQTRKITLREPVTSVVFELTPTYEIGLDRPIMYRIAWRRGSFGRIESREFSMPNQNVDFDDLFDLGHIVSGENYLTQDDLGVPGRVAQLNSDGQVIDANGNIILSGDTIDLRVQLDNEIMQRRAADDAVMRDLRSEFGKGLEDLRKARDTALGSAVNQLNTLITNEATTRSTEDNAIRDSLQTLQGSISTKASKLREEFAAANIALGKSKADLVDGKIPANQIPDIALGTAVVVEDQAEMLQLTSKQVQPGDLAVRPDGTFILIDREPGNLNSWKRITSEAAVSSVNGNTGAVTLSYDDVGARSATAPIPMREILGVEDALSDKADKSQLTSIWSRINTESNSLTTLTGRVDRMRNDWTQAVNEARTSANDSAASAEAAATTANNISQVETIVSGIKNDITSLQDNINTTAEEVKGDASEVRSNIDLMADLSAVATTAAYFILDQFGPTVRSVNGVEADEDGNISIFGGGTDLSLTEDPDNPGLYHIAANP